MLMQLNPPLPLETPKGKAWAVALIDYGPHWDLQWITFLRDSGECWTFQNRDIRQEANYTFGIPAPSPIRPHMNSHPMPDTQRPLPPGMNGHIPQ